MPAPGFLTDAQATTEVEAVLKQPNGYTATFWAQIILRANQRAYVTIVNALKSRGFTLTQIDGWDYGDGFQRDLCCFFAGCAGGAVDPATFNKELLDVFDRRTELETVPIIVDGEEVEPPNTSFSTGAMDTTTDIFVWPDPDSTELGEITRF